MRERAQRRLLIANDTRRTLQLVKDRDRLSREVIPVLRKLGEKTDTVSFSVRFASFQDLPASSRSHTRMSESMSQRARSHS